jgi:DNA (cytosine-5)-methyltransferase 1
LAKVIAVSVKEQLLRPKRTQTYPARGLGFQSTFRQRQRERTNHFKDVACQKIAERFPNVRVLSNKRVDRSENYFVAYAGYFTKQMLPVMQEIELGRTYYSVTELRRKSEICLEVRPMVCAKKGAKSISIEISGLAKYLIEVDRLECTAQINSHDDIFKVWSIVESALVKGSQFYTLIDIYGHYANRGDTVRVKTTFSDGRRSLLERAVEFFGTSGGAGAFMSELDVSRSLGIDVSAIPDLIGKLRSMRWDVRSQKTHPTIRHESILCTYPFPLLSEKAQLERRLA